MIYNRLIALRSYSKRALADIDVQLMQRADLVPQLVSVVKGFVKHELSVFTEVTKARARAMDSTKGESIEERAQAESMMNQSLMSLFAVSEDYPELKSNSNFQSLQEEMAEIEDKIAGARRFFNNSTTEYNIYSAQFPANVIAGIFRFDQSPLYEPPEDKKHTLNNAPEIQF
jgi:LemA protein